MSPSPSVSIRRSVSIVIALIPLVTAATGASGQRVEGRLLESGTRRPIVLGTVALLDTAMAVVDETFSDEEGRFALSATRPGSFYVLAQRIGYTRKIDGVLELGDNGLITVDFFLRAEPVALDSVTVESRRQHTLGYLHEVGYYERLESGSAWFLGPDALERSSSPTVTRLLQSAPGAMVLEHSTGPTLLFRSNTVHPDRGNLDPAGFCTPRVLVDGATVGTYWSNPGTAVAGAIIDEAVDVDDIAAIEVHTGPASLPLVFGGSVDNGCATVIIWTIQARPVRTGGSPPRMSGQGR